MNDPNVKTIGAAVGDTLSAAGAAVALFPGGQVIGGGLFAVGVATRVISAFVDNIIHSHDQQDDEKKLLGETFDDYQNDPTSVLSKMTQQQRQDVAARIANSTASISDLAKDADLTPDQLQQFAANTPSLGEVWGKRLNDIARLSGLKGQAFVDDMSNLGKKVDVSYQLEDLLGFPDRKSEAQAQAGQEADWKNLTGQERVDFETKRTQELYDQQTRIDLQSRGLLPR